MKCYVLMIANNYPKTHLRAGEPTWFPVKIIGETKIHTIRTNYELWAKRFEKIYAGEAYISLRTWDEKPYRSKQTEICKLTKENGIGIQKLMPGDNGFIEIDGFPTTHYNLELAQNDGLSMDDFNEWFPDFHLNKSPKAIIHFTDFRYFTLSF